MFINNNLKIKVDEENKVLWIGIDLQEKLCYSLSFLDNLVQVKDLIVYFIKKENIKYVCAYSLNQGIWNLGGDLEFFVNCIKNKKKRELTDYAYKCIDLVYQYNNNYETNVISACVVQGNAFGGGFESALSGNYIIAEKAAKFSFPEVIFGTFPGMGAYSFLSKKVGFTAANNIIKSNKTYTAQDVFDMGVIDKVVENNMGISEMNKAILSGELDKKFDNPFISICNKVSKKELIDIVDVWVDKAFTLTDNNINRMVKIANFQRRKQVQENTKEQVSTEIEQEIKTAEINSIINSSF
ncbi:MAG: crotonase/enoyl-CoA hydratase family protein [Chitinophagaceae bacterium]